MPRDPKRARVQQYWQWCYRDLESGPISETTVQLTEDEAMRLPEAEKIEGSMLLIEMDLDDFPETGPEATRSLRRSGGTPTIRLKHSLLRDRGTGAAKMWTQNLRSRDRPLTSGNLSCAHEVHASAPGKSS